VDMVLGTTVQPCTVKVISCCTCAEIFVCMSVCECMRAHERLYKFREVDGVVRKVNGV
jgi:hypothetical protein